MARFKRQKDGRFRTKSDTDRKVRSIRATDSAWESLGDIAEAQNLSRADLMEQLVSDGKLDCIQGLEALQAIAQRLDSEDESIPLQQLTETLNPAQNLESLQELVHHLQSIQDLAHRLEPIRELVQQLEPVQMLAQQLESVQNLTQRLMPIQTLAQQLEPIYEVERLHVLGEQAEIVQTVAEQIGSSLNASALHSSAPNSSASNAQELDEQAQLAIALEVIERFYKERGYTECSLSTRKKANPSLVDIQRWIVERLRTLNTPSR